MNGEFLGAKFLEFDVHYSDRFLIKCKTNALISAL